MGMTFQESVRARKIAPMNPSEIIDYYSSDGEQLPDRFSDTEQAKQNKIVGRYRPYQIRHDETR